MPVGSTNAFAHAYRLFCLAFVLLPFGPLAHAQGGAASTGPFAGLSGSWSGSGTIALSDGRTERLRCQATYAVASAGMNLRQNLRCASDSYNFELRTDVDYQGGNIAGRWAETTRNVEGRISGSANAGRINAVAQGPGFAAGLAMSTRSGRQSVSIRSSGTELSQVSIDLTRKR
jgi:hypothetical protein